MRDGKNYFGAGPGNSLLPQSKLLLRLHKITRPQTQTVSTGREFVKNRKDTGSRQLEGYFLRAGASGPVVTLLKAALTKCLSPKPSLNASAEFDSDTERALTRLQATANITVDGIAGPATWTLIGRQLHYGLDELPLAADVPPWIRRLLSNDPATARLSGIDVPGAFALYQFGYGPLSLTQRRGFSDLVTTMAADTDLADLRWAAYMLATVKHECAETWRPVEEYGKGAAASMAKPRK